MMNSLYLLLIFGFLQGSYSQTVYISQIPVVTATDGTSVTLQCNYTFSSGDGTSVGWFKWYRHVPNGPEVSDKNPYYKGRVDRGSQSDHVSKRSANIVLHRVDPTDTGMYICHVAFNFGKFSGYGNGTFLIVTAGNREDIFIQNLIRILLGVLILVVILPVILFCDSKGRIHSRHDCKAAEIEK